jgi:hypothetical protein
MALIKQYLVLYVFKRLLVAISLVAICDLIHCNGQSVRTQQKVLHEVSDAGMQSNTFAAVLLT